MLMKILQGR